MKKLFKLGCGGLIALFVLVLVIGLIFGEDSSKNVDTTQSSSTTNENETSTKQPEKEKVVGLNEELTVGDVAFTVHNFGEVNEISAANGFAKYTPDAQGAIFLIVNLTVKNLGNQMIQTDSSFFKLKTDDGAEYSPTIIPVADDKFFLYEGINPGLALTGNVVFEVPSGLSGLNLQVQTGYWGTQKNIIKLN